MNLYQFRLLRKSRTFFFFRSQEEGGDYVNGFGLCLRPNTINKTQKLGPVLAHQSASIQIQPIRFGPNTIQLLGPIFPCEGLPF